MRTGRLRHVVNLERVVVTTNDWGQQVETWAAYATVWAGIEPLFGREFIAAQQETGTVQIRIIIRYRDDVLATDRVSHAGKIYALTSPPINPDLRRRELQLMCQEQAP